MTPERWKEVQRQLDIVLSLPRLERQTLMESIGAKDVELRRELESLLAVEADSEFMNVPALRLVENFSLEFPPAPSAMIGRILGAYRITSPLGVGGMGEVYLAVRADGHYDQQVAIKIVRPGLGSVYSSIRFHNERQILAKLDHPNIAKILDGGATEDGLPYFVMEFIDGLHITDYCDQNRLSIEDRFRLFRDVCSAVHYAHQHLVVHRDIKPSNILVTPQGRPKLLDFGIAKMLRPDSSAKDATVVGVLAMTPEYASPEQLRGEVITTATDVYSLGLVLYELLTGQRPHEFSGRTPHEITRIVLESEPDRPRNAVFRKPAPNNSAERSDSVQTSVAACDLRGFSSVQKLHRRLAGDVDNIVLKALRKEPGERYASADQLSEDIRRHLERRPIIASKGSTAYRFRKYVLRHKAGVASAAIIFLTLVAGIVVTVREARIAKRNEIRAEQRFNDLRKLANSLIFDIHDSIQNLPGSTPSRKLLLDQAVQYLDSLSKESAGDISLQRELASAFQRVGLLQGNALDANLGQTEAGIVSLQKSLSLFESVAKANPRNVEDQIKLAHAQWVLSSILGNSGRPGARELIQKALGITDGLMKLDPTNRSLLLERSGEFGHLASLQDESGDVEGSLASLKTALSIHDDILKADPTNRKVEGNIAVYRVRIGVGLAQLGQRSAALDIGHSGLVLFRSLAHDHNDARAQRQLATAIGYVAGIHLMNGDFPQALTLVKESSGIVQRLQAADPDNVLYRMDTAGSHAGFGCVYTRMGRPHEGLKELKLALDMYEQQRKRDSTYADIPYWLGETHVWMGEAFSMLGNNRAALEEYRKGTENFESLLKGTVGNGTRCDLAASYNKLAGALAVRGEPKEAALYYSKSLSIVEPLASSSAPSILALYAAADAYSGMGSLASKSARSLEAAPSIQEPGPNDKCVWFRKSLDVWQRIPNPSRIGPTSYGSAGFGVGDPAIVSRALRTCDELVSTSPKRR
jgi:eukaryotic-like serine/threonine-protein kinase